MKTLKKISKYRGVTMDINKLTGTITWICRLQRRGLKFTKRFPFTSRGEEMASKIYQQKINELYTTK